MNKQAEEPGGRTARQAYTADMERWSTEAYSRHTVVEQVADGHWIIRRNKGHTGCFWTRIIAAQPYLILVGDAETAVFMGHPSDGPLGMVRWVGKSSCDHIAGKCDMGMGTDSNSAAYTFDHDVAADDLRDHMSEIREEFKAEEEDHEDDPDARDRQARRDQLDARLEPYDDALNALQDSIQQAQQVIADEVEDGFEIAGGIGRVIAPRVFYARAACRRLLALLDIVRPGPLEGGP